MVSAKSKSAYWYFMYAALCLSALRLSADQSNHSPSVEVVAVHHMYETPVTSLKAVDFKNLNYVVFEEEYAVSSFRLKNGSTSVRFPSGGGDSLSVDDIHFLPTANEAKKALVILRSDSYGGSSSQWAYIQVFEVENETLKVTQQISYDLQAPGTGAAFDEKSGILTVRARTNDDSAHCCPKNIDIVTLRWDGQKFVKKSQRTVPVRKE